MRRRTLAAIVVGAIASLGLANKANGELYDDFSSGSLDTTKWVESTSLTFTDDHFVDPKEEVYHIAQYTPSDRDTILTLTRQFFPGETLEHDIIYRSGSGNQQTQLMINNGLNYTYADECSTPSPGCGGVGHWNGDTDVGVQIGTYHRHYEFFDDHILMATTRPDSTTITHNIINISQPYAIGFTTHTGNNGIMHFDFDNFYVNRIPAIPTLSPTGLVALTIGVLGAGAYVLGKRKND